MITPKDYLSASSDLQEVLRLDPNVREAELELEVVTGLLRQSLMDNPVHTSRVKQVLCITLTLQMRDLSFILVIIMQHKVRVVRPAEDVKIFAGSEQFGDKV